MFKIENFYFVYIGIVDCSILKFGVGIFFRMIKPTLIILYLITKVSATCNTRYYENDLYSRYGDYPESGCPRRYVDIYTNYPDLPTTLKNYDTFRKYGEKYIYPSSSNDRRQVFNNYYETTNVDKADVELESEFGDFQVTNSTTIVTDCRSNKLLLGHNRSSFE